MSDQEINFDGLIGPTHNYAGLSFGNIASKSNKSAVSNPRQAALEGLSKMAQLSSLGLPQAVMPPHERPHIPTLRRLGFSGSDAQILESAQQNAPLLLRQVSSASSMWCANAATVSPSADTQDGRVHFTPANLLSMPHRAIESAQTKRLLEAIFSDPEHFCVHDPLPYMPNMGDEGAANHTRLMGHDASKAIELFVYGRSQGSDVAPSQFPARQSLEASQAIARLHGLMDARTVFVQQSPKAIDAGAFHNDVVCVGHRHVLFYHQAAFDGDELPMRFSQKLGEGFVPICVSEGEVALKDCVSSYLFNSQLVDLIEDGQFSGALRLIAPIECHDAPSVRAYIDRLIASGGPIKAVTYVDVRQSMRNGGGPACLRLRVGLNETQMGAFNQAVRFTPALHAALKAVIESHYRDRLHADDLADPQLLHESRVALDEFSQILRLGSVYEFQSS